MAHPKPAATLLAMVLLATVLLALMLPGCGSADGESQRMTAAAADVMFTDLAALQPPGSPNTWFVAPNGFSHATADAIAPEFAVDAVRLAAAWRAVVTAEPRTTIVGVAADGLQIEAQQRSSVFGFVDDISFRAIPLAAERATCVVYSRARVGYWDLGVNRRRVGAWLKTLRQAVDEN